MEQVLSMKLEQLASMNPIPVDVAKRYVVNEDGGQSAALKSEATDIGYCRGGAVGPAGSLGAPLGSKRVKAGAAVTSRALVSSQLPTHAQMFALASSPSAAPGATAAAAAAASAGDGAPLWDKLSIQQVKVDQSFFVNLEASVLEIRNLAPREGFTANVLNSLKGVQVSSTASNKTPAGGGGARGSGRMQVSSADAQMHLSGRGI